MKKGFILAIIFILLAAAPAMGSEFLLSGVLVTGSGTVEVSTPYPDHTYTVTIVDANTSITVCTVALEGSLDGVSWFTIDGSEHTLDATELTALTCMRHVLDRHVDFVRGKVTLTGEDGTTDTVTMIYSNGR